MSAIPEGMTVRFNRDLGEWRVNYKGASERYAYYTSDKQDAFNTATLMASNRPAVLKPDLRINKGV